MIFLDDSPQNLKPAKEMGMTTILVKNPITALSDLKRITGIDVSLIYQQRTNSIQSTSILVCSFDFFYSFSPSFLPLVIHLFVISSICKVDSQLQVVNQLDCQSINFYCIFHKPASNNNFIIIILRFALPSVKQQLFVNFQD